MGIGYWGSLACRAGLVTDAPDERFLTAYVRPYYAAIATWYATMGIGVAGGRVHDAVTDALADAGATFRPLLNPGHLVSYEEWMHSPIRPGSDEPLASGMVFQCDIIPTPLPAGTALNCEDTVALADEALRAELAREHPDLWGGSRPAAFSCGGVGPPTRAGRPSPVRGERLPAAVLVGRRAGLRGGVASQLPDPDPIAHLDLGRRAAVRGVVATHAVVEEGERVGHGAVRAGVLREAQAEAGELDAGVATVTSPRRTRSPSAVSIRRPAAKSCSPYN